jgi:rubredoxin
MTQESAPFLLVLDKGEPHHAIPMILHCPQCGARHIDEEAFASVAHHTHACQGCGFVWRPAKVNTHGVRFLPGYKNEGVGQ